MTDIKVVTPTDLDEVTVKLNQDGKVEVDFDVVKRYVHSRAGGLVSNGYGTLLNNLNFSKFTFDPSIATIGAGAFTTDTRNADFTADELIPVSPALEYTFSFYAQSLGGGTNNRAYAYIAPIDADGESITPIHMSEITFTAERLQRGEKYLIVAADDRQKMEAYFRPKANTAYTMGLLSADYTSKNGFKYAEGTYSRQFLAQRLRNATQLTYDPSTGRLEGFEIIKTLEAGQKFGISTATGTYVYLMPTLGDHVIPDTPTFYKRTFTVDNVSKSGVHKRMMAVASFIKIGWLLNRGSTPGHRTAIWAVDVRSQNPQKLINDGAGELVFTGKSATVDLEFNGIQLIFRECANSHHPFMMTGILYQGTWYGDAPNGQLYVNPFRSG